MWLHFNGAIKVRDLSDSPLPARGRFATDYGECEVVPDIVNRRALQICACSLGPMSMVRVEIE